MATEVRKPTANTNPSGYWQDPTNAYDTTTGGDTTTWATLENDLGLLGHLAVADAPAGSIIFTNWQTTSETYTACGLYIKWKTNDLTGDDTWGIEYSDDGGSTWGNWALNSGTNRSTTIATTYKNILGVDLSLLQVRFPMWKEKGSDGDRIYLYDVYTVGTYAPTTPASDTRGARTWGKTTDNDTRGCRTIGSQDDNDTRGARTWGGIASSDTRGARTWGGIADSDTRGCRTWGTTAATPVSDTRGARTWGKTTDNDTRGARTWGKTTDNDTRGARTWGKTTDNDTRGARTWGGIADSDTRAARTICESVGIFEVDCYPEVHQTTITSIQGDGEHGQGQSFTVSTHATLDSCNFYLKRLNNPPGNVYAKVYAHSGNYGTTSIPTGTPLAVSDPYPCSSLTTNLRMIPFVFSGADRINLSASTMYYCVTVEYILGDMNNLISVGYDSSPTHSGNESSLLSGTWTPYDVDVIFCVFGVSAGTPASDTRGARTWGGIADSDTRGCRTIGTTAGTPASDTRGARTWGGIASSDTRGARTWGSTTASDTRGARTWGGIASSDTRGARTWGGIADSDTRGCRTWGGIVSADTRGARTWGKTTDNDTRGSRTWGKTSDSDTRGCRTRGSVVYIYDIQSSVTQSEAGAFPWYPGDDSETFELLP